MLAIDFIVPHEAAHSRTYIHLFLRLVVSSCVVFAFSLLSSLSVLSLSLLLACTECTVMVLVLGSL